MTVYVDDMYLIPMGEFRGMKMSHMIADTPDELHAMADAIGLARRHYQGDHYDVSMSLRRKAIASGAIAITLRELAKMSRKPRAKKTGKQIEGMLAALKFIEPASKDIGQANQTHCMFWNNWVAAFDGLIMMAAKIDTDITAFPNTKRLIATLSRCDEAVQITQLDNNRLGIKSGKFSAYVPCIEAGLIAFTPPDPPAGVFNESVVNALKCVGIIAKENAPRMVQASILLRHSSAVATDGVAVFESWHGLPMPSVVLPKLFVAELLKINKKPTMAGASATTFTVYFEDESFIRTQLYTEPYPDVDRVLNVAASPYAIQPELWAALAKLDAMKSDQHDVYFNAKGSKLQTDADENVGAIYEFEHPIPDGVRFNLDYLRRFEPFAKTVDWGCGPDGKMSMFYGDNFRGCLMQKTTRAASVEQAPAPAEMTTAYSPQQIEQAVAQMPGAYPSGGLDDEIPF
jgi:hypothetical protein